MTLQIFFLGPTEIRQDGQPLDLPGYRPLALLAYLMLTGKAHSRDHLVDLLFDRPDDPRAALRWTLFKLRKVVGEEAIVADRQVISFNFDGDYVFDVAAFEAGDLEQFRGELLEGLYLRDARQYEAWLLGERQRLNALYQQGLEERLAGQQATGDAAGAEETARNLVQLDPLREDWQQALIDAYAAQGKFESALAQFDLAAGILREELDQDPSAETAALAERVRAEQAAMYRLASRQNNGVAKSTTQDLESAPGVEDGGGPAAPESGRRMQIGIVFGLMLILLAGLLVWRQFADRRDQAVAAAPDLAGKTVTVGGIYNDAEGGLYGEKFRQFEERTGIVVELINYGEEFEPVIDDVINSGYRPDLIRFPQPGYLADFVRQGEVIDLYSFMDEEFLRQHYNEALLESATIDGQLAGLWSIANVKSLVWYPKAEFEAAGYSEPHTWEELMALTEQIAADGRVPWCIGIESGPATGWVATDWLENILLRIQPPSVYDAWVAGELPFDSPEVRQALAIMADIWMNEAYVYGGAETILAERPFDNALRMFEDPPGCYLNSQGSFLVSFLPQDAQFGKDFDFFFLPPIDPQYGRPVLGGGDIYGMFNDRPEVREVMRYLATGESVRAFVEAGGHIAPHRDADFEWYSSPVTLKAAQILLEADTYRFDGSDMMPGVVGTGSFWQGMADWVAGEDLDMVLKGIDESWPEE
jgi:alpha-glucoside transport system substrate-binding protein